MHRKVSLKINVTVILLPILLLISDFGLIAQSSQDHQNDHYFVDIPTSTIRSAANGSAESIVLLTIDDGPQIETTIGFLDLLDKYDVKALFFINGYLAEPHPQIVREIIDRGHKIGNHTWGHRRLSEEDPETTEFEILELNKWLERKADYTPRFFRAPYGVLTPEAEKILDKSDMTHIGWSVNSYDWMITYNEESFDRDVTAIVDQTLRSMEDGNIILIHDRIVSLSALEQILEELTGQGYEFVLPAE